MCLISSSSFFSLFFCLLNIFPENLSVNVRNIPYSIRKQTKIYLLQSFVSFIVANGINGLMKNQIKWTSKKNAIGQL